MYIPLFTTHTPYIDKWFKIPFVNKMVIITTVNRWDGETMYPDDELWIRLYDADEFRIMRLHGFEDAKEEMED